MTKPLHSDPINLEERARRYLGKMPPAIAGSHGHDATFRAACVLRVGFDLDFDTCVKLMMEWNQTCQPPWAQKEIERKVGQADKERDKEPAHIGRLKGAKNDTRPTGQSQKQPSQPSRKKRQNTVDGRDDLISRPADEVEPAAGVAAEEDVDPTDAWIDDATPASGGQQAPAEGDGPPPDPYAQVRAIYGSKRKLWHAIIAADRKARADYAEQHGEAASMPDTIWIDGRAAAELPESIDGMTVEPSPEAGVVRAGWERRDA